jgi:hypothetical protein
MQANSLFTGDVNNDGYIDLAVSDNNQLAGSGKFKIYLNNNGMLNTTPFWTSSFSGYGSGIILEDVDNDSDPDLITGAWWSPIRIYLNNNGNFNTNPDYTSSTNSVVEAIFIGDVNKNGVENVTEYLTANGIKKIFYMPRAPLQYINRIIVNNDTLTLDEFCYDLETGWISLPNAPASGVQIRVETAVSFSLDMGVTNWDSNIGNYLFTNALIPVELISFTASVTGTNVQLQWATATETNNQGFEIERKVISNQSTVISKWNLIDFVKGKGTTTEQQFYSFTDQNLSAGKYQYRLKQIDFDGSFEYSNTVEADVNLPNEFSLSQNYPNPFNPTTEIKYTIPSVSPNEVKGFLVTLKVYDFLGNEVAILVNEEKSAGTYEVRFDGDALASGIYIYKLSAGNFIETKKMIFLK